VKQKKGKPDKGRGKVKWLPFFEEQGMGFCEFVNTLQGRWSAFSGIENRKF
jgi:hypothetical protein